MKKYKIKKTRKLVKQLEPYWKEMKLLEEGVWKKILKLEKRMEKDTGIPGIEFFSCDNEVVGIGNVDRTMPLIHFE